MYFQFVEDVVIISHNGANRPKSSTTLQFVKVAKLRHRGEVWCLRLPCYKFVEIEYADAVDAVCAY